MTRPEALTSAPWLQPQPAGFGPRHALHRLDELDDLLREHLGRHGVGHGELARSAATSLAFARIGEDGSASCDFRFGWRFSGPVPLDGVTCLHTGSPATFVEPGAAQVREVMRAAAAAGVVVSYDPDIRPSLVGDRASALTAVEECVRLSRLVKVSAEDLAWLYPGEPDLDVARRWAAFRSGSPGERLVEVTRGGDGASAILGGGELTAERVRDALRHGCAAGGHRVHQGGRGPAEPAGDRRTALHDAAPV
ncbi:hypothetical protein ACFQQB_57515 [Nonomuraea rubra]|uniref:hypothetical protein n=1 Tax=Nonomuraea rubra TaxID=46180 RepID=UPI00361D4703